MALNNAFVPSVIEGLAVSHSGVFLFGDMPERCTTGPVKAGLGYQRIVDSVALPTNTEVYVDINRHRVSTDIKFNYLKWTAPYKKLSLIHI